MLRFGAEFENLFVGAYGIKYDGKTNLHYMRYRWYSADQMRFLSPDLLLDINRYAYCNNNPIKYVDMLGLKGDYLVVLYFSDPQKDSSNKVTAYSPVIDISRYHGKQGVKIEKFTRKSLNNALQNGKTIFIATHGATPLCPNPERFQDPIHLYTFRGLYAHQSKDDPDNHLFQGHYNVGKGETVILPNELCQMIRKLKKAGKLKTKYLLVGACASGNLPVNCRNISQHLTYIAPKLPMHATSFNQFALDFAYQIDTNQIKTKHDLEYYLSQQRFYGRDTAHYNYFMVYTTSGTTAIKPTGHINPSIIQVNW